MLEKCMENVGKISVKCRQNIDKISVKRAKNVGKKAKKKTSIFYFDMIECV